MKMSEQFIEKDTNKSGVVNMENFKSAVITATKHFKEKDLKMESNELSRGLFKDYALMKNLIT